MAGYFDRIKESFQSKPPVAPPAPQGANPPPQDPNNPNVQQGGKPGSNPSNQQQPQVNPANWYEDLYSNTQEDPDKAPEFSLDGEKLKSLSSGQQFITKDSITPEMQAKFAQGDFSDMVTLINQAAQGSHRAALEHGSTLTGKFVEARDSFSEKKFGGRVKTTQVEQELSGLPNYNNPAVKSHLNDIANRLSRQHPDASPREIALEAQRLLMEIANGVNPENTPEAKARLKDGETDFMKWLGQETQQS